MRRLGSAWALATLVLVAPAGAQSLNSAYGFGTPVEPVDGRAVVLGGVGVGLMGDALNPLDPAAAADLVLPGVTFTSRTGWTQVDGDRGPSDFTTTRFPILGILYPVASVGTVSLSLASVLDQSWEVNETRLISLEGTGTQARVTDRFVSEGGVSALRLALSRRLSPSLSVGVSLGSYLGDVTRRFARSFDSLEVETGVPDLDIGGVWEYGGLVAGAALSWDLGEVARLGLAYNLGGDLDASPTADTDGAPLTVEVPGELRAGGTAILAELLTVSAGVTYADWSGAAAGLSDVVGSSVLRVGGGIEWAGARLLGKSSAVRVGYRRGDLPFHRQGDAQVSEGIWAFGLGLNLLQSESLVLAQVDLAGERGSRDSGLFTEEFWRMTVSVRLSGF